MFNKSNAAYIGSEAQRILNNPSTRMGRKMRRFLQNSCAEILPGELHLAQCYAALEGYTPEQLQALKAFAEERMTHMDTERAKAPVEAGNLVYDECMGIVTVYYRLKTDLAAAPVRELRALLRFLAVLAVDMSVELGDPNASALANCPDYIYRGLPCSVVEDDELWAVSGQDVRGGSGVLEWCVSERDAADVQAQMNRFPERFLNVSAHKWSALVNAAASPDEAQAAQAA